MPKQREINKNFRKMFRIEVVRLVKTNLLKYLYFLSRACVILYKTKVDFFQMRSPTFYYRFIYS